MSDSNVIPFPGPGLDGDEPRSSQPKAVGRGISIMRSDLVVKASQVIEDAPVLINMVSQRVRQLNNGRPPLIRVIERMGAADIALQEIIEGKIVAENLPVTGGASS